MSANLVDLNPATAARGTPHVVSASACPMPGVLVIDDDPHFRELAKSLLACRGIQAAEAGTASQALKYLKAHAREVQVVVVDVVMPDQDGLDVIREIRRAFGRLKVLAVSGADAGDLYLRICSHLGADAVLPKSEIELLVAAVRRLLRD